MGSRLPQLCGFSCVGAQTGSTLGRERPTLAGPPMPPSRRAPSPTLPRRRRAPALHSEPPEGSNAQPARLIARETADQTLAIGLRRPWFGDLYHRTLRLGWCSFLLGGSAVYFIANALFALLYLVQPGAITNARPGSFWDAFFFSIQT